MAKLMFIVEFIYTLPCNPTSTKKRNDGSAMAGDGPLTCVMDQIKNRDVSLVPCGKGSCLIAKITSRMDKPGQGFGVFLFICLKPVLKPG